MLGVATTEPGTRRSWLVPARRTDPEIMDGEGQSEEEMAAALREIRSVNKWLGGLNAVLGPLAERASRGGWRRLSVLDVGTGSADIPRALAQGALGPGFDVRAAGVDLHPLIAKLARDAGEGSGRRGEQERVSILRGDGLRLPFRDGAFDVVTASLFLHHFETPAATALVAEFARVARRLVLVNDLERHRMPWLAIRLVSTVLRSSRMFRYDAPLSVLRAFTSEELLAIGRRAGLPAESLSIEKRAAWRLVLCVDREMR